MERASVELLLDSLRQGWLLLRDDGRSAAMISPVHAEGLVAPLYTTPELASDSAQAFAPHGNFEPRPAPPLWQVARLLAEQGFAGLLVNDQVPLFFVTTHEEAASKLPTHVAISSGDDYVLVGEDGVEELGKQDVALWVDLERFDHLSNAWLLRDELPFVGYEDGMELFEYLPAGMLQVTQEQGALLEASGTATSAVPFFSTAYNAEWYWEEVADVRFTGEGEWAEQLAVHEDVPELLDSRAAILPDVALILNPGRHRFYQGFFRYAGGRWYLVTINGVWLVMAPFVCRQVARRT